MKNELVKFKIVVEDYGTGLTIYYWEKFFWIFGFWVPYGSVSSNGKIPTDHINIDTVSKVLFDNFIKP